MVPVRTGHSTGLARLLCSGDRGGGWRVPDPTERCEQRLGVAGPRMSYRMDEKQRVRRTRCQTAGYAVGRARPKPSTLPGPARLLKAFWGWGPFREPSFERRRRHGAEMRMHPGGSGPCSGVQGGARADACAVTARLGEQTTPRRPPAVGDRARHANSSGAAATGHLVSLRQQPPGRWQEERCFPGSLGRERERPASRHAEGSSTDRCPVCRREDGRSRSRHQGGPCWTLVFSIWE